ncbi:hypothetical protein ACFE04_012899 [Oxalis oulophora]
MKISKSSSSCNSLLLLLLLSGYSTIAAGKGGQPQPWSYSKSKHPLYREISPAGNPTVSIVPILDNWVKNGNTIDKEDLVVMIKDLIHYKRYVHALQISKWMTEKRYMDLSGSDHSIRLDLITKIHGIQEAENYFNNIPQKLKLKLYTTLLKCYADVKSVDKAESILEKMKDLGLITTPYPYNIVLNLYKQIGDLEKLDNLLHDMEANKICSNKFTYGICMAAYADSFDTDRVEKMLKNMESNTEVNPDWVTYSSIANLYTKLGIFDKASIMLKKSEALVSHDKQRTAYDYFLSQYAAIGDKNEVLRIWELYKLKGKVYNKGYSSMINSLLNLEDIERAEKIFEEWESQNLSYDIWIPNYLIGYYSRKGLMEKAENLINRVIEKGGKPDAMAWFYTITGYFLNHDMVKAVEALKEAIKASRRGWTPNKETLAICLDYLKREGDVNQAKELISLMGEKDIFPEIVELYK